jgi:hypothetical protein
MRHTTVPIANYDISYVSPPYTYTHALHIPMYSNTDKYTDDLSDPIGHAPTVLYISKRSTSVNFMVSRGYMCVCNLTSRWLDLAHDVPIKAPGSASSHPRCCC